MINLLFISNNPRAELLKVHFQQLLKIRIELLADFDQGLRDVFEKRPVVVCIQEEIAGVTGESVARHIQLLLGGGSPKFILMHEGNEKARALPGLFSYLLDLSIPFEAVCDTLGNQLKSLLGTKWDTLYSPATELPPVADLQKLNTGQSEVYATKVSDEDEVKEAITTKPQYIDISKAPDKEPLISAPSELLKEPSKLSATPEKKTRQGISTHPAPNLNQGVTGKKVFTGRQSLPTGESKNDDDASIAVEQFLNIFEESDRKKKKALFIAGAILLILVVGGLFLLISNRSVSKIKIEPDLKKQALVHPPSTAPVQPAISAAKSTTLALQPVSLPSFIPKSGHDPEFSAKKPGWVRYVSKNRDYRLFYEKNNLRALQLLAIENSSISVTELQSVIRELIGSEKYKSLRYEKRQGIVLEHGMLQGKQELLIYKRSKKGSIRAFVVTFTP